MSHFTVLVIGDDYEKQLQPYHEYECTGIKDEFVRWVPIDDGLTPGTEEFDEFWDEEMALFEEMKVKYDYRDLDHYMEDYHGMEKYVPANDARNLDTESEEYKRCMALLPGFDTASRYGRFTNPNAKWDWYSVGGRWTGYFKVKPNAKAGVGNPGVFGNKALPGYADQLLKKDIDMVGQREDRMMKAEVEYDKFEEATKGLEVPPKFSELVTKHKEAGQSIEEARAEWQTFPWPKALREANLDPIFECTHEHWFVGTGGREAYIKSAAEHTAVPYAVVHEGQWMAKGEMGWFGMDSDNMTEKEWIDGFNKLISELPGDTVFTLVDCHI